MISDYVNASLNIASSRAPQRTPRAWAANALTEGGGGQGIHGRGNQGDHVPNIHHKSASVRTIKIAPEIASRFSFSCCLLVRSVVSRA